MPHLDTDEQRARSSVSLVCAHYEDWSDFVYRRLHRKTHHLARRLHAPIILNDVEYHFLPVLFHVTGVVTDEGFVQVLQHGTRDCVYHVTACRLECRPGYVPHRDWKSIQQSLVRLTEFTQEGVGEFVSTESLFSYSDTGEMFLVLYSRKEGDEAGTTILVSKL